LKCGERVGKPHPYGDYGLKSAIAIAFTATINSPFDCIKRFQASLTEF
jgi:hypothetical protein